MRSHKIGYLKITFCGTYTLSNSSSDLLLRMRSCLTTISTLKWRSSSFLGRSRFGGPPQFDPLEPTTVERTKTVVSYESNTVSWRRKPCTLYPARTLRTHHRTVWRRTFSLKLNLLFFTCLLNFLCMVINVWFYVLIVILHVKRGDWV